MTIDFSQLFHLTFLFWVILDSAGNIPLFVSLLKHFEPKKQRTIIMRELTIALVVLLLALFFGKGFFNLINISNTSLLISGGIILFLIAVKMIFAVPNAGKITASPRDPLIVPLAIPATAGPAILATITLYAGSDVSKLTVFLAIILSWVLSIPPLIFSPYLKQLFKDNGIVAIERLFGFIIVIIATDMVLRGITSAITS